MWAARNRTDLFEKVFKRPVQFEVVPSKKDGSHEHSVHRTFEQPHTFPGKLIIVEGIDGSGKSTQLLLLQKWLESKGFNVFFTEWNSSELVRETTQDGQRKTRALTPTTFSLLHATDFASRLYHEILPPLKAGMVVLADRYMYTAFARDVVRGVSPRGIRKLYNFAIRPDLAFYFRFPSMWPCLGCWAALGPSSNTMKPAWTWD